MSDAKHRRRKLLEQTPADLNGIDYVVVSNAQRTAIAVHFLTTAPVASTLAAAAVAGGHTGAAIPITSLNWGVDAFNRPLLTLNLATPGDSAFYTLSLTSTALDPFFDQAQFSFFAGAPTTIDCKTQTILASAPATAIPPIDYLAKDFLSFREALSGFSTIHYPAWQERSEADFGVMFMEALCALADDLSYQQDRVAAEAYLATATERISVTRHARLVDYEPTPALAASVLLQFSALPGVNVIPPGLAVSASNPDGSAINFETGAGLADAQNYAANPAQFLANAPQYFVSEKWNGMDAYWWDDSTRMLSAGATQMWVVGHDLGLTPGLTLLVDTTPTETGLPNIREVAQLKSLEEQTDALYGKQVTRLVFESALAQSHDLAATTVKGNLIPATQGLRRTETFAITNGPPNTPLAITRTGPNQTLLHLYTLGAGPLTWLSASSAAFAAYTPEIQLTQLPALAATSPLNWPWCLSLLDAAAFGPAFTIDATRYAQLPAEFSGGGGHFDYDGAGGDTLRFGDNDFGLTPHAGTVFTVTYRAGAGKIGNVAADSITTIDPTGPLAQLAGAVTNPFPAQDGADAEPIDSVVRLAPYAYQATRFNAILPADYVAAAETLPWLERAGCVFRHTGSWLTAFTTVEPANASAPTDDQTRELMTVLDRYRLAGFQSYVLPPAYKSLDLRITASAKSDSFDADVAAAILAALGTSTAPNGGAGFFQHDNFAFGQPLERSALEAAMQNARGVAGISSVRFRRSGTAAPYVEMPDRVNVGVNEIIRVDNNPKQPDAGSIHVSVGGGK
jgi:hypothetical protein